jgi:7-carboxy-7-deazaguanine synthase
MNQTISIESKGRAKAQTIRVSEIYGPVCQGEGMLIGRPTIFVRLGGCDYRCSWCDSLYAVLPEYRHEWRPMTAEQIAGAVKVLLPGGRGHVTLSGGNPAIHNLAELVGRLGTFSRVAIETQASVNPHWIRFVDDITLSPKPPSSGNVTPFIDDTPLAAIIHEWRARQVQAQMDSVGFDQTICLKVVVFNGADYEYARAVHLAYPDIPFYVQAGTEVGKASRDDLCDALATLQDNVLADPAMQDVAVLPQLHAILKGHSRGI